MSRRGEELLERIAKGIEKLGDDPELHIESGPPVCPFCQTLNPEISVETDEGGGPFAEFVIAPTCGVCHERFFAVTIEWATFQTYQDAEAELDRRREVFNVGDKQEAE